MTDRLERPTVLVLNRNWQAINARSPVQVIGQMATDAATALDIDGDAIAPVKWADWLRLPVRDQDESIRTIHGPVRLPTVIVLARYADVPRRCPPFSPRAVAERDQWTCQYTGRRLRPGEGNIDHIVPRSQGGPTNWDNCVLVDAKINTHKGARRPEEAGLRLLRKPAAPKTVPVTMLLRNKQGIADWDRFLPF